MIRALVRLSLVVVGLAAVVDGTASLTGGWLGTPPWWKHSERDLAGEWREKWIEQPKRYHAPMTGLRTGYPPNPEMFATAPTPHRGWISGGVVAAGTALVAFGAWPRRRASVAP